MISKYKSKCYAKTKRMEDDTMYDVDTYSDQELYEFLNFFSVPTDRELEHKIYSMMEKYKESSKEFEFFHNILKRFFDLEEAPDEEAEEVNQEQVVKLEDKFQEGFQQKQEDTPSAKVGNMKVQQGSLEPDSAPQTIKQIEYSKGNLNPLLKESIKRIVSVDSQFREKKLFPHSTAFTFNLSEPLKDVVSMKLYSIQLPYTWYTISDGFGSNFFYIKGNSPGIDNGNFDHMISIQSGNYQAPDFVNYLNQSFQQVFQNNPDINFGTTGVTYNSVNSKLTTIVDIQNIYNEVNYELIFPSSSFTPYSPTNHNITSIPQMLGYANSQYRPNTIYSSPIPNTRSDSFYIVDSSNSTFYIYVYKGPGEFVPYMANNSNPAVTKDYLFNTVTITIPEGRYSESEIVSHVNSQISSNTMIKSEQSFLSTTSYGRIFPNTYIYNMTIVLDRKKIKNTTHVKYVAYFPDSNANPLWVGPSSCFKFPSNYQEFNSINSEYNSEVTTLFLNSSPTIHLKCNLPFYGDVDTDVNDKQIQIPLSDSNGYTIPQYFNTINDQFHQLSQETNRSFDCYIDTSNNLSLPTIHLNIYKVFYNNEFYIDLSGSIFDVTMNFPKIMDSTISTSTHTPTTPANVDESETISSNFNLESGYVIFDAKNPAYTGLPNNRITIYSIGEGNKLVPPVDVYLPIPGGGSMGFYRDTATLIRTINNVFSSIKTTDLSDNAFHNIDMTNSYLTYTISATGTVSCTFHMDVRAVLSERDFDVILSDPNDHTWSTYLHFQEDTPYKVIVDPSSHIGTIQGNDGVYTNQLYLTEKNNFFYINPVYNPLGGVYTKNGDYNMTITLTLPLESYYTKEQIVQNMNEVLYNNPITQGSVMEVSNVYSSFRMNINKIFTAKDYRIVFYDSASFTRCNFGLPTNATYDTVLGWILGFRNQTEYFLTEDYLSTDQTLGTTYYGEFSNQPFTYNKTTGIVTLTGDTSINVNLYNYVMLILDDFTLNRLNDGLVTVTTTDMDIPLPSYASRNYICDVNTGKLVFGNVPLDKTSGKHMTANQLYAANQLLLNKRSKDNMKSSGPFVQDIFALVPIRTNGMQPGQTYIEFGGSLQNQERIYFGPVDIRKMSIQLLNDKGTLLDLNGANWSFSLLIEQLYNPNRG